MINMTTKNNFHKKKGTASFVFTELLFFFWSTQEELKMIGKYWSPLPIAKKRRRRYRGRVTP